MSDKGKQSGKSNTETRGEVNGEPTPEAVKGELVKRDEGGDLTTAAPGLGFLKTLGMEKDLAGFEQTASGQVTKWFDIRPMMSDPTVSDKEPTKALPNVGFAGVLLGMGEMTVQEGEGGEEVEDEETGEVRKVRMFYFLRLQTTCPVTWKDEKNEEHTDMAQPGELIAVGERFAFKKWRALAADPGRYVVVAQPVERRRLRRNPKRLMWHFNLWEKELPRPTPKVRVETAPATR